MNLGTVDPEFKFLEGGLLHISNEPHLFWSLMINWKFARKCFPQPLPPSPSPQKNSTLSLSHSLAQSLSLYDAANAEEEEPTLADDCWAVKELDRCFVPMAKSSLAGGAPPKILKSNSLAFCAVLKDEKDFLLIDTLNDAPTELPGWWVDLEKLWGGLMERLEVEGDGSLSHIEEEREEGKGKGKAPCLYYCTPAGCALGEVCVCVHDALWAVEIAIVKQARGVWRH